MGKKYRRYKNALEKFLSSDSGRRFFHIVYSLGAAIVILGALFKLNHYPYGNTVILIGLGTEAFIFILSAFDTPSKEYPWEEVFPEFATPEQLEQKKIYEEKKKLKEAAQASPDVIPEDVAPVSGTKEYIRPAAPNEKISGSVKDKVVAPAQIPSVAPGSVPVVSVSETASGEIPVPSQPGSYTPDMAQASEKYVAQVNQMSGNVEKFNELTLSLNKLSDVLITSFKNITDNSEGIGESTKGYISQMENLNRNISGLNTIYEIQLKGVSSQIDAIDQINTGLNRMKRLYEGSIPDSAAFKVETERLAQQLKELNLVYARMLQAMTTNMATGSGFPGSSSMDPNKNL